MKSQRKEDAMAENEIKAIQKAIKEKQFDWEPGETPLSSLTEAQQQAYLGLIVDEDELKATAAAIEAQETMMAYEADFAVPAKVDWRNRDGDWTTPVKDQQGCGSCVSFGVSATIEARINLACKQQNLNKNLSEAHLFFCGCGNCCGNGWNFPPALDFCKNTGIGLEADFAYSDSDQPCKQGVKPFTKISGWTKLLSMADRKKVLAEKGPVVGGFAVYSDFFSYKNGVYKQTSDQLRGYHATCVVGYDDEQKCWICKNSWGTSWGDSGWFKIGYGQCLIDTSFGFYDVDLKCPQPCDKYKTIALKYYAYHKRTGNRRYLCLFYRYAAAYYYCLYKDTKSRKYLCLYYRYMAQYYYCMYGITKNKRYLTYYKRYLTAYNSCR